MRQPPTAQCNNGPEELSVYGQEGLKLGIRHVEAVNSSLKETVVRNKSSQRRKLRGEIGPRRGSLGRAGAVKVQETTAERNSQEQACRQRGGR